MNDTLVIERLVEYAERTNDKELAVMLAELLVEIQNTLGWVVVTVRDRFDNEFGAGAYSPELLRAMDYVGVEYGRVETGDDASKIYGP